MKIQIIKNNLVIKIPVKKLSELLKNKEMEEVNTPTEETPVEEVKEDANITPEAPTGDTVDATSGTEPSPAVQE
jgi:hypothetical protein